MSITSALASLLLSTSLALAQAADPAAAPGTVAPPPAGEAMPDGPPADAPMDLPPGFAAVKPMSEAWKADETSAASVQKGQEAVAALAKAYASAAAIEDAVTMVMTIPGAGEQRQEMGIAFGPAGSARLTAPDAVITRVGDDLFFEQGPGSGKYLKITKAGSFADAMEEAFGGAMLPLPEIGLRSGDAAKAIEALGGPFVPGAAVAGFRPGPDGKGGVVMLKGENAGEVEVTIDPASGRLAGIAYQAVPPGAPSGFRVPINLKVASAAFEKDLPKPIAFDAAGRKAVDSIERLQQALDTGDDAPAFTLKDTDGKEVSLASLKGSVVVLDFWATWCKPCMRGLPLVDAFAKWAASSGKPIKVFAVNVMEQEDDPAERTKGITEFWKAQGFSFPTLVDTQDVTTAAYGVQGIPFTVVIGPDGKVIDMHTGLSPTLVEDLKKAAEAALAAKPAGG
jgi:cytochrome c biogenesis protein CcmG/thiol:disulfide interchange protein DsbE